MSALQDQLAKREAELASVQSRLLAARDHLVELENRLKDATHALASNLVGRYEGTFLGTVVGQAFTSDAVSVLFLSLAAGSILYVVIQLVGVALRAGHKEMLYWGVFLGLVAGFATDFVVTAAGV